MELQKCHHATKNLVIFKCRHIVYARVMEFVWFFVFYFVGLMVSSFTLIPVLIILFFGIPLTNKLEKKGLLKKHNGIKRGYTFNIIVFPVVYYGIYWTISHFFPVGTVGFLIGTATPLFFGLGQLGANKNNVSDYFEVNKRHFTADPEEVLIAALHR
jgi:hypothetical protein